MGGVDERRLDLSAGGLWHMVYGDLADDYECCVTMAAMLYFVAPRFLRHLSVSPITTSILMLIIIIMSTYSLLGIYCHRLPLPRNARQSFLLT